MPAGIFPFFGDTAPRDAWQALKPRPASGELRKEEIPFTIEQGTRSTPIGHRLRRRPTGFTVKNQDVACNIFQTDEDKAKTTDDRIYVSTDSASFPVKGKIEVS